MIDTKVFKIDEDSPDTGLIKEAGAIIARGGLLAFPTETVYGLGADATDSRAAKRIYAAKGRPSDNPLIVHISDMDMLKTVAEGEFDRVEALAEKFWPGPLTLILPKSDRIPAETTGGLDTVAVRMPAPRVARLIIEAAGVPVAAPSANISGRPSPTRADHVLEDFSGRIDAVVDSGDSVIGIESTILDLTAENPVILRQGFIQGRDIGRVLGCEVSEGPAMEETDRPKAPGMKYKHYAPNTELICFTGRAESITEEINRRIQSSRYRIGVICSEETKDSYNGAITYCLGSAHDGRTMMHRLYATLRQLDADGIDIAYCEDFGDSEYATVITERLHRASDGNIIRL